MTRAARGHTLLETMAGIVLLATTSVVCAQWVVVASRSMHRDAAESVRRRTLEELADSILAGPAPLGLESSGMLDLMPWPDQMAGHVEEVTIRWLTPEDSGSRHHWLVLSSGASHAFRILSLPDDSNAPKRHAVPSRARGGMP